MKKSRLFTLVCLILVLAFLISYTGFNKSTKGLIFELQDKTYCVDGYGGTSKKVTIPDTHKGIKVEGIGIGAFQDDENIQSVKCGQYITEIAPLAFNSCSNLKSIILSDTLKTIAGSAFGNCTSITSISLPEGLEFIASWAFDDCTAIPEIVIPASVSKVAPRAFNGWTKDQTIIIEGSTDKWYDDWDEGCNANIIYANNK